MKIFSLRKYVEYTKSIDFTEFENEIKKYCKENERCFDNIKWLQSQSDVYIILTAIVG